MATSPRLKKPVNNCQKPDNDSRLKSSIERLSTFLFMTLFFARTMQSQTIHQLTTLVGLPAAKARILSTGMEISRLSASRVL